MKKFFMVIVLCLICTMSFGQEWDKIGTSLESSKIEQVRQLQGMGRNITILSENDFLRLF